MMKPLCLMILNLSIILSLTVKNWFILWFIMEFNLYTFIPIVMNKYKLKMNSNNMMYYYLIQFIGSSMFILMNILIMMNSNFLFNEMINKLIMISILMKLGMFPFYFWYINLMKNLNWMNCLILSTLQKIIPLLLLMNLFSQNLILLLINIMNTIFSTIMGMNQINLKKIFSFSSMNHLSWMMMLVMLMEKMFFKYMIIYFIINTKLMSFMNKMNLKSINELFNLNINFYLKNITLMNILSLSGTPPMMGFLMKWLSLTIIYNNFYLMTNMMILMLTSTLTLFYYMNMFISSLMYFNSMNKFNSKYFINYPISSITVMLMYFSLIGLIYNNMIN